MMRKFVSAQVTGPVSPSRSGAGSAPVAVSSIELQLDYAKVFLIFASSIHSNVSLVNIKCCFIDREF